MAKVLYPLEDVYQLLEPGPVILLTTAWQGQVNVMAQSWYTMLEFDPPLVGVVVSLGSLSFEMLSAAKECVINIPTEDLAAEVVGCGNTSGRDTDKFRALHLTPDLASLVKAPLVRQCYANIECKAVDMSMVPKYNLFILEAVSAWIDPACERPRTLHHRGCGIFAICDRTIAMRSRMK